MNLIYICQYCSHINSETFVSGLLRIGLHIEWVKQVAPELYESVFC